MLHGQMTDIYGSCWHLTTWHWQQCYFGVWAWAEIWTNILFDCRFSWDNFEVRNVFGIGIHLRKRRELDHKWSFMKAQMLKEDSSVLQHFRPTINRKSSSILHHTGFLWEIVKWEGIKIGMLERLFQRAMKKWTFQQNSRAKVVKNDRKRSSIGPQKKEVWAFRFWCNPILQSLTKSETNVNGL